MQWWFVNKSLSQKVRSAPFRKLQICILRNEREYVTDICRLSALGDEIHVILDLRYRALRD